MISLLAEKMITEIPILVTQMRRRKKEVTKSFVRRDFLITARLAPLGDHWKFLQKADRSSLTRTRTHGLKGKFYWLSKIIQIFSGFFFPLCLVIGIIAPRSVTT